MPLSTRHKNVHQHPGLILLGNTKNRHTKKEVATDNEKRRFNEETTKAALDNLCQFIADEEDMLAEDKATTESTTMLPPSQRPPPLAHQNEITISDSDSERNSDVETQGKKTVMSLIWTTAKTTMPDKGESDLSVSDIEDSEDPASSGFSDDEVEGEKTKKEQRRDTRDAIQVLRKQTIDKGEATSKTCVVADKTGGSVRTYHV
jgi:hypothetical protein